MAVARRNGSIGATAPLAAVLAVSQLLLLATHSGACSAGGYSPCPKPPPVPVPAPCPPTPRAPSGGGGTGSQQQGGRCPVNALKLGACASVLGGLLSLELGQQADLAAAASSSSPTTTQQAGLAAAASSSSPTTTQQPCCHLLGGLADLDAAVCLCTALRANVLGLVQLSIPVQLSVVVNSCGKKVPQGFQCPS